MKQALEGLKVIEVGHMLAGPFCGTMLADFGADVIKIEPPETGDLGRTALYFAGPALVLLLAILILVKKRKQQIEQQTMMSI